MTQTRPLDALEMRRHLLGGELLNGPHQEPLVLPHVVRDDDVAR